MNKYSPGRLIRKIDVILFVRHSRFCKSKLNLHAQSASVPSQSGAVLDLPCVQKGWPNVCSLAELETHRADEHTLFV